MNNQMREKFEAWHLDRFGWIKGSKRNNNVSNRWIVWQAAIASQESIAKPELPVKPVAIRWPARGKHYHAGVNDTVPAHALEMAENLYTEAQLREYGNERVRAALSASGQTAQAAIPEGWKLVPLEPSIEMLMKAGENMPDMFDVGDEYRAMVADAPPPPKDGGCQSCIGDKCTTGKNCVACEHHPTPQPSQVSEQDKFGEALDASRMALTAMLKQFTRTPSTLKDSAARSLGHAALKLIDAAIAARQPKPE